MNRLLRNVAILLIAMPLLLGCGRKYNLSGVVVVIDGERSTITEYPRNNFPNIGVAIPNAKVTLFHELNGEKPNRESPWKRTVETDEKGHFELSDYATPGTKNHVGIEVEATGYETAYIAYDDYQKPDMQYFFIVLRPKP